MYRAPGRRPIAATRPRFRRRRLGAVAILMGLAALSAIGRGGASAHSELVSSDPPANSTLPKSPPALHLEFTEAIDGATAKVRLVDENQAEVAGVGPLTTDAAGTTATAPLPELKPGVYAVDYRVTSAVDGHVTAGVFAFLIDPTGTQPAPTVAAQASSPSADAATIAARWLSLAATLVLFGLAFFWLISARPVLLAGARTAPWLTIAAAGVVALGSLALYLALAARPFASAVAGHGAHEGGIPLDFAAPFGWTPFAIAMRVAEVGTLAALGVAIGRVVFLDKGSRRGQAVNDVAERMALVLVLVFATIGLAGISLAGHATSLGGLGFGALDLVHLLAAGAWLGVLPAILLLAWRRRRGGSEAALAAALRRHSRVATVAAPIVALTGIANSPLVLGQARSLVATDYGNLVLAKGLLFSVAFAIGSANHFLIERGAVRRMLPLLAAELAIAALAVSAAAAMVTIVPGASRQPVLSASAIGTEHLYGTAGDSTVHVAVTLPAPGNQQYQVAVADAVNGAPPTNLQKVFLRFVPPSGSGLPAERIELAPQPQPGLYAVSGAYTPTVGSWTVDAVVRRAGQRDASVSFVLSVIQPLPPKRVPPPDTGIGVPLPLGAIWALLPAGPLGWLPTVVALLGVAAIALIARRRALSTRWRAGGIVLLLLAITLGIGAGSRAVVDAANAPPAGSAAAVNPVAPDAASVKRGADIYLANCAACHGVNGAGDGPTAAWMFPPPGSLPAAVDSLTTGDLQYRITNGLAGTRMPAFAVTLSENDRWDLVNYLRARWSKEAK
ncbi:MAG: copper resistance protein CopC [Chloroflexota bacterium]|nr:copper resistance protein CopC [Chloroflexota bacterium]